jgi:predicted DNA-binding protein (MmcQ/YjbR family)
MLDYNKAKPSLFVEEQLPSFVKTDGEVFINFLKTYYDWLERKIVILNLKATNPISETDLLLEEYINVGEDTFFIIEKETPDDGFISTYICSEEQDIVDLYDDYNSLSFNGFSNYMSVESNILPDSSDWTIGMWINMDEFPKVLENDMDVITLSNEVYFSLINLSETDNKLHIKIDDLEDINTNLYMNKKQWYFITIRYNNTEKKFYYDLLSFDGSYQTYISDVIDISLYTLNRFIIGYDVFSSESTGNFFAGLIDSVSVWDKYLANEEILSIFNDGTAIDITSNTGNYISSTDLTDFWRFETGNTSVALNSINTSHNADLYNLPKYLNDTPFNLGVVITEFDQLISGSYIYNKYILLKILSSINYEGADEIEDSVKMKVFAEHISGKLSEDLTILSTANNIISIDTFQEMKNPLNAINNIANYQDIDFIYNYDNFIAGNYFQYLFAEYMHGIPLYFYTTIDKTIKDIIGKEIKQLYLGKGTIDSFKYLFKILYNENIEIVEVDKYEYTIKTKKYASQETQDIVKNVLHPVGYKVNYEPI